MAIYSPTNNDRGLGMDNWAHSYERQGKRWCSMDKDLNALYRSYLLELLTTNALICALVTVIKLPIHTTTIQRHE